MDPGISARLPKQNVEMLLPKPVKEISVYLFNYVWKIANSIAYTLSKYFPDNYS